jgi:hypothetical protein
LPGDIIKELLFPAGPPPIPPPPPQSITVKAKQWLEIGSVRDLVVPIIGWIEI